MRELALERFKLENLPLPLLPPVSSSVGRAQAERAAMTDAALDRFAFYQCAVCALPYFGGAKECQVTYRLSPSAALAPGLA